MTSPAENGAWVAIQLPDPWSRLEPLFLNLEYLFRLNPYLRVDEWQPVPDGVALASLNEMNGVVSRRHLQVTLLTEAKKWLILYDTGIKAATEISWQAREDGSQLTIRETYHEPGNAGSLAEVDRSLIPWGMAIRRHLLWRRWLGWLLPVRLYLDWLPTLQPSHRRITRWLVGSSLLELALLTLLLAG